MEVPSNEQSGSRSFPFLLLGAVFYWASIAPLNLWPLAFLVPVCWSIAVFDPRPFRYRRVYIYALLFWLASLWWIACPHPLTSVGLLALAGYLAVYWPLFFASSRVAVLQLKVPPVLAMPACWIGCEYLRFHLLGGFSFCSLEHALFRQPKFIQVADIGGQYLVGGMIMLVGAGVGTMLACAMKPREKATAPEKNRPLPEGSVSAVLALTVLIVCVSYGFSMLRTQGEADRKSYRFAALQGNIPVTLDGSLEQAEATLKQFIDLSFQAARQEEGTPDLIIWPETVCPVPFLHVRDGVPPSGFGWEEHQIEFGREQFQQMHQFVRSVGVPILCGLSTYDFVKPPEPARLNSALLIDPDLEREPGPRYDKVHLVMFGEYIPFSGWLPESFFLKTLCQEAGRGAGPVAIPLGRSPETISVNICFESTVPHLIRNQVLTLKEQGKNPGILVNMSNDGWFRFSQQIDQHLATHVFRAIENRRPCVTATNGGFSALIDEKGRILHIGQRRQAEAVCGDLFPNTGTPPYHLIGDWPATACMILVVLLVVGGAVQARRAKRHSTASPQPQP